MRKKNLLAAALLAAAGLTLSACSTGAEDKKSESGFEISAEPKTKAATVLDDPFTKPDLVLTDTRGKSFDLRKETKGKPTLVYFGYTHCPDVCPLTMSNLATARKALPKADQERLQVVFVTTDPERDTSAELAKWLPSAGDASFIGLTGDFADIQAGARSMGIGIEAPTKDKNGDVVSMHGAQVVAFSPETDEGYALYGEDTSVDEWTKDLPKLVKGAKP
ncbi:SCO family protein [Streptomyces sp. NPDC005805]|uniref:SCO family protein n=1 Tax=Streptomyces sp. NPDC005805 TaxID=3157068 RepID=UPI0033C87DCA